MICRVNFGPSRLFEKRRGLANDNREEATRYLYFPDDTLLPENQEKLTICAVSFE